MCPRSPVSAWLSQTAQPTCDLTFRASPLRGIAPSRFRAGSSAFVALLLLITYTSPSSRQPILGVTPGLCFLRNPSPYALRLAPAPVIQSVSERPYGVTPFPVPMVASVGRCSPPGFSGSAHRSVSKAAGALSCAFWLQRVSLLRWFAFTMAQRTFAYAAPRCLLDGIPGSRLPGSAV
jgi:hypothetical protein